MIHFARQLLISLGVVSLLAALSVAAFGQPSAPDHLPVPDPSPAPKAPMPMVFHGGDQSEKAIAVDKSVNFTLCVTQGNVKVNGWNRGEIRVVVRDGTRFNFKVQAKNSAGVPALVSLYAIDMKGRGSSDCLWGDEIEIDAPANATVTVKGKEIHTAVDTIRRATVYIIGGDILLRNVAEGVTASTFEGDITVEESTGPMNLETTTGNVVVFDSGPREIGDNFRAKTSGGNLSLQQLSYRQVEVNSTSGSVMFTGNVIDGASYMLGTTNGSIRMHIPTTTNCQLSAIFSAGRFDTEIPYKLLTENISEGSVKHINAKFGKGGESIIKATTSNGSISIRKL